MARVGVVIPLYNKARLIERCLRSVLDQPISDLEVVVVDDGSNDDGPALVERCEDPRVRLVRQENAGPGGARNRGIQELDTPLVGFLDADDYWQPEFLGASLANLERHPECVLSCAGQYVLRDDRPGPIDMTPAYGNAGVTSGPWEPEPDIGPRKFKWALDFFHSDAVLCRREIVERYGGFYAANKCRYGEDTWIWLQVTLNHKVYRDLRPLVCVDWGGSDLSMGNAQMKPPRPFLTDPEPIYAVTPPQYRSAVDRLMAYYALERAMGLSKHSRHEEARELLNRYPLARSWHPDYLGPRLRRFVGRLLGRQVRNREEAAV